MPALITMQFQRAVAGAAAGVVSYWPKSDFTFSRQWLEG